MPIYKTKDGKYKIQNVPGTSHTLEKAKERLRAIKARQHAEGKEKSHK